MKLLIVILFVLSSCNTEDISPVINDLGSSEDLSQEDQNQVDQRRMDQGIKDDMGKDSSKDVEGGLPTLILDYPFAPMLFENDKIELRGRYKNADEIYVNEEAALLEPTNLTWTMSLSLSEWDNEVLITAENANGKTEKNIKLRRDVLIKTSNELIVDKEQEKGWYILRKEGKIVEFSLSEGSRKTLIPYVDTAPNNRSHRVAYSADSKLLYVVRNDNVLDIIDTKDASIVSVSTQKLHGLTYGNHILWGVNDENKIVKINTATGVSTVISSTITTTIDRLFWDDTRLIALSHRRVSTQHILRKIDEVNIESGKSIDRGSLGTLPLHIGWQYAYDSKTNDLYYSLRSVPKIFKFNIDIQVESSFEVGKNTTFALYYDTDSKSLFRANKKAVFEIDAVFHKENVLTSNSHPKVKEIHDIGPLFPMQKSIWLEKDKVLFSSDYSYGFTKKDTSQTPLAVLAFAQSEDDLLVLHDSRISRYDEQMRKKTTNFSVEFVTNFLPPREKKDYYFSTLKGIFRWRNPGIAPERISRAKTKSMLWLGDKILVVNLRDIGILDPETGSFSPKYYGGEFTNIGRIERYNETTVLVRNDNDILFVDTKTDKVKRKVAIPTVLELKTTMYLDRENDRLWFEGGYVLDLKSEQGAYFLR